jgi:hypothetical protein
MTGRCSWRLAVGATVIASASAYGQPPEAAQALRSVQPMDAYGYCRTIASAEFAGRLTGHEGYTAAARWAAARLEALGVKPVAGLDRYLQAYPSPYTVVDRAEMTLLVPEGRDAGESAASKEQKLEVGKDFLPLLFTASGEHEAGLVFAGWAIRAPEAGYDDYAGVDVAGKYVLCFRGTPDGADKRFEPHDHHRARMKTARDRGALGIIYIAPEASANPNGDWLEGFTPATITEKAADALLKEKGVAATDLRKDLTTYRRPISFPLATRIRYSVASRHFPEGIGYNVVGKVEGSDSALRGDVVVIGAHFDHCGLHMGMHFPGANDNASGSAVVLEVAEAFSKLGRKAKRPVAFVLFGGEEMGLMGSTHFAEHLPAEILRVDAMFNIDMAGEGDGTGCAVSATAPELKKLLEEADLRVKTLRGVREIWGIGVRSSDFAPFFAKGAPCLSCSSNGPHVQYHLTGDTIYRINPDMLADVARLVFLTAYAWANR